MQNLSLTTPMEASPLYLSLPWSVGKTITAEHNLKIDPWKRIQRIFDEDKGISTSKDLVQFMQALLIRRERRIFFSSLKYAVDEKLSSEEKALFLSEVIPWMKELVLQASSSMEDIPLMKSGGNSMIQLSRQHIITLLTCSFFSLFCRPEKYDFRHYWILDKVRCFSVPNMFVMLSAEPSPSQVSKVYAILLYFITCYEYREAYFTQEPINLERSHLKVFPDFSASDKPLLPVTLTDKLIEEDATTLQAIFANKLIGGGVLGHGCVQEEIRLIVSPELLVALALCEQLEESEALFCDGALQFVSYSGYARSFNVEGRIAPHNLEGSSAVFPLVLSATKASVVWMDAISFRRMSKDAQYSKTYIDREVKKSYVAFRRRKDALKNDATIISTGNWGCGAFCGDPQLKILLQWCSASEAERSIQYSVFDQSLEGFDKVKKKLEEEKWTVGRLYSSLIGFQSSPNHFKHIIDYVLQL